MKEKSLETEKQLTTEVTSIAQEEARTGQKIETPSADNLAARASASFIRNRQCFNQYFSELSARGKTRVMNAVLDLPADGVPVYLKDDLEKKTFAVGQRVVSDRFIITQHHIVKEVRKQREAIAKAKSEAEKRSNGLDEMVKINQETGQYDKEEKTLDKETDKS